MNKTLTPDWIPETNTVLEPERYELLKPPVHHFEIDRRDFAKIIGTGIAIFLISKGAMAQQQGESGGRGGGQGMPKDIAAWLHIAEDGAITVFTGQVEIGQKYSARRWHRCVAEELRAPFESITMVMGDTKMTPYDAGTFGSQTTPRMGMQLRHVASVACDTLRDLAAKQWNVDAARLVATAGKITDPATKRSISYGQLAQGQGFETAVLAEDPLIAPADWTIAGKPMGKVDGRDFVTGRHKYTSDVKLPDMQYGKVLRPDSFGATAASIDVSAAKTMPGVTLVQDGDFVGVTAPDPQTAERALKAIKVEWKPLANQPSSSTIYDYLKENIQTGGRGGVRGPQASSTTNNAPIESALTAAQHRLDATYKVAFIAHAPLEPRAAVAQWADGQLNVWTGTQRPFGVRSELAGAFHLAEDKNLGAGKCRTWVPGMAASTPANARWKRRVWQKARASR